MSYNTFFKVDSLSVSANSLVFRRKLPLKENQSQETSKNTNNFRSLLKMPSTVQTET